jgi:hypothetical protein
MEVWVRRSRILGAWLILLAAAAPLHAQRGFSFSVDFGYTGVSGGEWSDVLDRGIHSEIMVDYLLPSGVIVGAGMYYVSYDLEPPVDEITLSNVQPQAMVGYVFSQGTVRPYVQLRGAVVRMRVEGHHEQTPLVEEGENTSPQRWGTGGVGSVGVEFVPWRYVTLDVAGWYGAFRTQDVDLTDFGGPLIASGRTYGIHIGIKWYPNP